MAPMAAPSDLIPILQEDREDWPESPRRGIKHRGFAVASLLVATMLIAFAFAFASSGGSSVEHGALRHSDWGAEVTLVSEHSSSKSGSTEKSSDDEKSSDGEEDETDEEADGEEEEEDEEEEDDKKKASSHDTDKDEKRSCTSIAGVQVAQDDDRTEVFPTCAAKWAEDCSKSGCCTDWDMKCYKKKTGWAACKASCEKKDEKNESWSCDVIYPPEPRTVETCMGKCKEDNTCKQSVFSSDGGGSCQLSKQRQPTVTWAGDNYNTTFCGTESEQEHVKLVADKVWEQLPYEVDTPHIQCSWGGEDCSETLCCNDFICDANYTNCNGYSCWKKDKYFSGCAAEPLDGWDGKWLGGPRERRTIPPAGSQVATQGTALYCFTVVTWNAPAPKPFWNSEAELANNWKDAGLHVLQCDGHDILDGVETPKAEWGSFSNIDMFMDIWDQVGKIGSYKNYDWTVKVDADAVFIPSRLKDHLYNLRTPKGARVYLENINFKFRFMGAIEIMTQQALDIFLEEGHDCIRGKHEGGEDSFLKGCLDGLGIDHQEDWLILRDKYAGLNPPCLDGWAVAYHYLKKAHDWSECYNEVMCGNKDGGGCDYGIAVPHPPGWA